MKNFKKDLKEKNIIYGRNRCMKKLMNEEVKKVYIAKDCTNGLKKEIRILAGENIGVIELDIESKEIGALMKKSFSISVLCY